MEEILTPRAQPRFSIIIPVLNEAAAIGGTLDRLRRLELSGEAEILVVDGDPAGGTLEAVAGDDVRKIRSPKGRARQMNAGASHAGGEILLFLHADTLLPPDALLLVAAAMADRGAVGGAFDLAFASPRPAFKVIAAVASCRSRLTRIPFGDQAIFLRRDCFQRIGGYREIPIMEEVELMGRIRRRGERIVIIDRPVLTSPRRWEKEGLLCCTLRNWLLQLLFRFGVAPERLAKLYRDW